MYLCFLLCTVLTTFWLFATFWPYWASTALSYAVSLFFCWARYFSGILFLHFGFAAFHNFLYHAYVLHTGVNLFFLCVSRSRPVCFYFPLCFLWFFSLLLLPVYELLPVVLVTKIRKYVSTALKQIWLCTGVCVLVSCASPYLHVPLHWCKPCGSFLCKYIFVASEFHQSCY